MRIRSALVAIVLLMATATVFPGAAAQDDAGTGTDAPDSCDQAQDVTRGTSFEGTLNASDGAEEDRDWYRVEVPDDKMLVVRVEVLNRGYVDIDPMDDGCEWTSYTYGDESDAQLLAINPEGSPAVRFSLETFEEDAVDYRVETEAHDLPDPAITSLKVEEEPVRTAVASAPTGTQRTVHVTLENQIAGSYPSGFDEYVSVRIHHDSGEDRFLGYRQFDPFSTEPQTLSFDWDGTGEVGDVTVEAEFWSGIDVDEDDQRRTTGSFVLVGGTGVGVDTLNREHRVRVGDTQVEYKSEYDNWGRFVDVDAQAPGAQAGPVFVESTYASAFVEDDQYETGAGAFALTPAGSAFVFAGDEGVGAGACIAGPAGVCVGIPLP